MHTPAALLAARNNVAWCDSVCRAHGARTANRHGLWWNTDPSPPYYPNLITAAPAVDAAQVGAVLLGLAHTGAELGVKDSFCTLDLAPFGYPVLFEAQWIWRDAVRAAPLPAARQLRWARVTTPAELQRWEAAWQPDRGSAATATPIYGASLLDAAHIAFVAGYDGMALVAGAALTTSDGTVGVACTFFQGPTPQAMRQELLSYVHETHPGHPVVGYESGDELEAMKALGFREVGPLRVWLANKP